MAIANISLWEMEGSLECWRVLESEATVSILFSLVIVLLFSSWMTLTVEFSGRKQLIRTVLQRVYLS